MTNTHEENVQKLAELIHGIKVAMMTTVDTDGAIHSRPMATQQTAFDGDLWFFTAAGSHKSEEVKRDARVNLTYVSHDDNRYVSVTGTAELWKDRIKAQELWSPFHLAWFPKGVEDPDLALLKITVEQAEYWDSPSSAAVKLAGFAKAVLAGQRHDGGGENRKIDL